MWANHNVARNYWNYHRYKDDDSRLWNGAVDWDNFKIIVDRVIKQYFHRPNYFKIDGCPVFSIFSYYELRESFDDDEGVKKAIDYFREQVQKAGFPDLHLQLIGDGPVNQDLINLAKAAGVNSVTKYNWGWPFESDYVAWGTKAMQRRDDWAAACDSIGIPYYPNASIGWDDTPRFPAKGYNDVVHNETPESFAAFLQKTKEFVDKRDGVKLITINSWNEWVEGSYLLPDMKNGFAYLDAVKRVMVDGEYDKRSQKQPAE
ncbi:MAG: glycoside hydrolase family 99-like domain-containing protein, partial [Muribaculaceae bacterium]|nr:glycoside hydrolase family 99-like domain-containing protein [Muribaculaceae bacterium]